MKHKAKLKVGIILIILALIAAAISLMIIKKENQTATVASVPTPKISPQISVNPSAAPSSTIVESSSSKSDWHVYQNSDYGFQIDFSDIWKGYEVKTTVNPKDKIEAEIDFTLKTTDSKFESSGSKTTPLIIFVYKSNNFTEELQNSFPQTKLDECKGFIFTYSTWEEPPQDLQGLADKEIADTLKTFQTSCKNN